jgi:hypothetical protein
LVSDFGFWLASSRRELRMVSGRSIIALLSVRGLACHCFADLLIYLLAIRKLLRVDLCPAWIT